MSRTKHLLLCFYFFSIINIVFSQSEKGIGLRGGVNISKLTNANLEAKVNGYFGIYYTVRLSELYALQPEFGYSNQGAKTRGSDNIYVEYFTFGITNKFFVIPENGFHILIAAGFDFDIDDSAIGWSNRNNSFDGNDATFIDLTMSLGLGYEFNNGLNIEARYKRGFIDVYSGSFHNFDSELFEYNNQFNSVFQIGMSYTFNLTKKNN